MFSDWWWSSGAEANEDGFEIKNSLRFRGAQLLESEFFGSSNTFGPNWTISFWVKFAGPIDTTRQIIATGTRTAGGNYVILSLNDATQGKLGFYSTAEKFSFNGRLFRDPGAWYHIVMSNDEVYINGEAQGAPANYWGNFDGCDKFGFSNWTGSPNSRATMYLADAYLVQQTLEPTAFGRELTTGQWVPREVDFTPAGIRNSDLVTAVSGSFNPATAAENPANLFNGNISGVAPAAFRMDLGNQTGSMWRWTPSADNPITVVNEVTTFPLQTAAYTFRASVNGVVTERTDGVAGPNGTPYTLTTGPGNLDWIEYGLANYASCMGIAIDGEMVTNPFLWSEQVFSSDATTIDWDTTSRAGFASSDPGGYGRAQMFDGNAASASGSNGQVDSQNWVAIWRPNPPINVTSMRIAPNSSSPGAQFPVFINGDNTTAVATLTGASIPTWQDVPFTGELKSIFVGPSTNSADNSGWQGIEINGGVFIDGENPSYGANGFHLDFSDPDDLGADRSGNGNDFNATNFNTDTPATVTGTYVDPSASNFVGGSFPTGDVSIAPYFIDADPADALGDHEGEGLIPVFNGVLDYAAGSVQWYGTQYANNVLSCNFDLRDFTADGVTSVEINDFYASPDNPRPFSVWLLDASKTKIPGSDWVYDNTKNGQFQSIPVPTGSSPAFIHFDCENEWRILSLAGIRINEVWINQLASSNPDYDLMQDSPTQNAATLNPLVAPPFGTSTKSANLFNANLGAGDPSAGSVDPAAFATIGINGRVYFEMTPVVGNTSLYVYLVPEDVNPADISGNTNRILTSNGDPSVSGTAYVRNADGSTATSALTGSNASETWGFSVDTSSGDVEVTLNGTLFGTGTGYTGNRLPCLKINGQTGVFKTYFNFGQQPFVYPAPAGFEKLQTQNLPAATITDGREHFRAITGPGTGGAAGGRQGSWIPDLFSAPPGDREQAHTSTSDVFQSAAGKFLAFDGNLGTVAETDQSQGRPGWMSFRPSDTSLPELTASTSFKVKVRRIAELWINGTQMTGDFTTNTGSLFDLSSQLTFPFTLESMEIGAISGQDAGLFGIELDSELLVQDGILEVAQATFPNGLWWIKARKTDANIDEHQLVDSVRNDGIAILSPAANLSSQAAAYSAPAGNSVAWCWNLRADRSNGFDIVNYTGNNTTIGDIQRDIPHQLGATPEFIICTSRGNDVTTSYASLVAHVGLQYGDTPATQFNLNLRSNVQAKDGYNTYGGGTVSLGDASNFSLVPGRYSNNQKNEQDKQYMAYLWTSVPGYSAFGTFVGVDDANGVFVSLGFRPAFLLIKQIDASRSWNIWDSTRDTANPNDVVLFPDIAGGEGTGYTLDFLSNGFKARKYDFNFNSNNPYIYAAFAENPFGASNTSPANAR